MQFRVKADLTAKYSPAAPCMSRGQLRLLNVFVDIVMNARAASRAIFPYSERMPRRLSPAGQMLQYSLGRRMVLLTNQTVMPAAGKSVNSSSLAKTIRPLPSSQASVAVLSSPTVKVQV